MSDDHAKDGGNPHQAHHFDTMQQQIEAGKLGMWLFLATEVMLFAGVFCAYCVYRTIHPEVFEFASKYLDTAWGATNTVVLIASSWTMALAVRAAQTNQRQKCLVLLGATLLGAAGFMGIKGVEYAHKFHDDLMWGIHFDPQNAKPRAVHWEAWQKEQKKTEAPIEVPDRKLGGGPVAYTAATTASESGLPRSVVAVPPSLVTAAAASGASDPGSQAPGGYDAEKVRNVQVFFGIYFCMTGLHGLHVIIGALVILWVMWRTWKGEFSSEYFLPVDLAGLYWHIVDLIWIFLFPLLYLIG